MKQTLRSRNCQWLNMDERIPMTQKLLSHRDCQWLDRTRVQVGLHSRPGRPERLIFSRSKVSPITWRSVPHLHQEPLLVY